jgi:uncharacterized protein DUF5684
MGTFTRNTVLVLWAWLMLAGVCLGKQVYLRDGGIVECESAWRRGDLFVVKINRDTLVEFERSEIDLRRTRFESGRKARRVGHKRSGGAVLSHVAAKAAVAGPLPAAPSAASKVPEVKPVQPAPAPVAKPVQPSPAPAAKPLSAPTPAPAAKEAVQPEPAAATSPEPAAPPGKEEAEKLRKQAAEMMAEAIRKKDPEMMKKAMELQRSTIPQSKAQSGGAGGGVSVTFLLIVLVVCLLIVVSMWVVFEKGGEAGWKCLIPFYNMYVLMAIAGKPGWWFVLLLIPLVGTVFYLLAMLALAERFGRGALFGIGLTFLPMIFFPLLAFGGSKPEEFEFA